MDNLTESGDESFLRWRVSFEEDDQIIESEEYGSEPLLKTMVRTNYLYHLRQSLRKNLEASKQKDNYAVDETLVNKVIKGCSAHLEEKALRNCMIAKLYQKMMMQMIKEVKKATNECTLYTPLQEFAEHQSKVSVCTTQHKETQTELDSLLFISQIADLYNLMHKNLNPVTETSDVSRVQTINGLPPPRARCTEFLNGISRPESQTSNIPVELVPANFNDTHEKTVLHKRKSYENPMNILDGEMAHTTTSSSAVTKLETPPFSQLLDDTRISGSAKSNVFENKLRSATFAESVALWYSLECEIEELPPAKKQKLEEKFVQLFGIDHAVDYYNLTNEQKSIACRKRIAKFVVEELTNFYSKKRVASKDLFKTLAKHITSVLLGRSLFPSPEEIKRSIEEFFSNDRVITSESDFL